MLVRYHDILVDGVVARSDLCKLHFDVNSTVGTAYSCDADPGFPLWGILPTPAHSGVVTAKGAAVARTILEGLHDSQGQLVYLSYQPGATFSDASTVYNTATNTWGLGISALGGEWVARFLQDANARTLGSLDGYTYDTLKQLMLLGMEKFGDVIQTTTPDIGAFRKAEARSCTCTASRTPRSQPVRPCTSMSRSGRSCTGT